jgi:hypothetical protein
MFIDRDTTLDSRPANIEETVADRSQPAAHYIELSSLSSQKTGPCASGFEKIIGNGRADCAGLTRLPKIQIPRASHSREILLAGDLKMDLDRHSLWKANEKIHLTPKEFELSSDRRAQKMSEKVVPPGTVISVFRGTSIVGCKSTGSDP